MADEKIFAEGFIARKNEGAPEWVIANLGININEAIPFLQKHADERGWVNIDVLEGRSGKPYAALNTYKPKKDGGTGEAKNKTESTPMPIPGSDDDELPF
jgi:hypothetical protein